MESQFGTHQGQSSSPPPQQPSVQQHPQEEWQLQPPLSPGISDMPTEITPKRTTHTKSSPPLVGGYAIWSRRPHDPAHAPGIIFSPNSKPPPHIVRGAIELRTPPPSPPLSSSDLLTIDDTDTPTETDTHTHPGSPASSNTSVDLTPSEPKDKENDAPILTTQPDDDDPSTMPSESLPEPEPVPPPLKKSWASLLQSPASTSSSGRNALPTSSVVGISIPASAPLPAISTLPYTRTQQAELLSLLTSGPSSAGNVGDIRPRGLINVGNMCFANAVLQVLVYCPPFYRLFIALGKAGVRLGAVKGEREKDKDREKREGEGAHLVEATVEFVKAFSASASDQDVFSDGAAGGGRMNGRAKLNGKGKEKEKEWDEWGEESFLPNYVYDAMKENKRFDHMRSGQQEDAEEFLGFYLDTLEEELLALHRALSPDPISQATDRSLNKSGSRHGVSAVEETLEKVQEGEGWLEVGKRNRMAVTRTIKGVETPITRIFGGKFRSTLRAPQQKDSVVVEDWRALRLDIQHDSIHTIQDALGHISDPQPIQLANSIRPGSQQVLIEALPQVLVVHLKRFYFNQDEAGSGVVKVEKQVAYGGELVVGPDVMGSTMKRVQGVRYKLFGVVYHHGHSASGGHYTLDVLHPNRYPNPRSGSSSSTSNNRSPNNTKGQVPGKGSKPDMTEGERRLVSDTREGWIRIDDELVSDVRAEDVFRYDGQEGGEGRCAYLLFYRRIR